MSNVMTAPMTPPGPTTTEPVLTARDLCKSFVMGDSTLHVLKHLDLTVQPGEMIAIEGRSGSGKSTLLHVLAGLDSADTGTVFVEGDEVSISGFNFRDRRMAKLRNEKFGFVFQFYHLLPELNALQNAMLAAMIQNSWLGFFGKRQAIEKRATELLTQLGLSHRLKHRSSHLSGGERQRVAIARALMNEPRVLFADEPTGNLDVETGTQIMGVLEKLHRERGQTIVMVTHDRTIAHRADRILVLREGRLQAPSDKLGESAGETR
jgi:lipoprotein-releasing system ATP-binding protein